MPQGNSGTATRPRATPARKGVGDAVSAVELRIGSGWTRDGEHRTDALLAALADRADTRVIVVDGDQVAVDAAGRPRFSTPGPSAVPVAYLGTDGAHAYVLALGDHGVDQGHGWAAARTLAPAATTATAEVLIEAIALGRWLREARFCPACGTETIVTTAGWARTCPACGREHFPRTDPAVIVAVTDGERLLLGSNALWPHGRFSCFAGFVEAGERAEDAVRREVAEEAGVHLRDVTYHRSQAWPYPRSLMLGFHAHVIADTARADGEEILEVRWFSSAQLRQVLTGQSEITLPAPGSIARELIEAWLAEHP